MKENYTLEKHLELSAGENSILLDTWRINKKRFEGILQATVLSYPTYSLHDFSHSKTVIENIECLLGEIGIKQLSLTDTWLILNASLLHDWGMVLTDSKIQEEISGENFKKFMEYNRYSNDKELSDAIKNIEEIKIEQPTVINAYNIRKSMTLILSEYFRSRHGENSHDYIMDNIFLKYNLSYDLIKERLVSLLADIVVCHTRDIVHILELPHRLMGQHKDIIHPRLVAILLRLGDLLDMDNDRFNENIYKTFFDELPGTSMQHFKKHHALKELLITESEIAIKIDCPDTLSYRVARQTLDWLNDDLTFFSLNWNRIVPYDYNGRPASIAKQEVLIKGQDVGHLQLKFSKEQIHNMLEGYNLYSEQFVCMRELIQNAIDASRIQLYRDIIQGRFGNNEDERLLSSPYEIIKDNLFEKFPINVIIKVEEVETDKIQVFFSVEDYGIGIDDDTLQSIANVCVSYKNRKKDRSEYEEMPKWLRPTGGFGIGLQSVFTLADILHISSKSEKEELAKTIEITSMKKGGYISVIKDDSKRTRGTIMSLEFEMLKNEIEEDNRNFFDYKTKRKFEKGIHLYTDLLISNITKHVARGQFPLYVNGRQVNNDIDKKFNVEEIGGQLIELTKDLSSDSSFDAKFRFWDKENMVFCEFYQLAGDARWRSGFCYRGITVNDENTWDYSDMGIMLDIYGEDVQDCLVYSRNKFNHMYKRKLGSVVDDVSKKMIKTLINILEMGRWCNYREILYTYILATKYGLQFDHTKIEAKLPVYELVEEKYQLQYIDLEQFIKLLKGEVYFIEGYGIFLPAFENLEYRNKKAVKEYSSLPDEVQEILDGLDYRPQYLIPDSSLVDFMLEDGNIAGLQDFDSFKLIKCNLNVKTTRLYHTDTEEKFVNKFLELNSDYEGVLCIESEKYEPLVTSYNIETDWFEYQRFTKCFYKTISPFLTTDIKEIDSCSKEEFIDKVTQREQFSRIVDTVYEYQKVAKCFSKEDIKAAYIELIKNVYDCKDTHSVNS